MIAFSIQAALRGRALRRQEHRGRPRVRGPAQNRIREVDASTLRPSRLGADISRGRSVGREDGSRCAPGLAIVGVSVRTPPSTAIAEALYAAPVSPLDAKRNPRDGGLPDSPGFYAWWHVPGSLPAVPSHPHPDGIKLDLLYVGIAPNSATSKQTIRSRVVGNHLGGNTGSSTFRYSLAALLMDAEKFQPTRRGAKYLLNNNDNRRLSEWQQAHLRLTWCAHTEPWTVEAGVIATMTPPMNLAENAAHPFYATMSAARRRFRGAAGAERTSG